MKGLSSTTPERRSELLTVTGAGPLINSHGHRMNIGRAFSKRATCMYFPSTLELYTEQVLIGSLESLQNNK